MKCLTIYDLLCTCEGDIIPIGETNYDRKASENLDSWREIWHKMEDDLIECAKGRNNRELASVKEVSDAARKMLRNTYKRLSDEIEKWDEEEGYDTEIIF